MFSNVNFKRGFFRVWVIGSIAWIVFSLIRGDNLSDIRYTYRYVFDKQNLLKEHINLYFNKDNFDRNKSSNPFSIYRIDLNKTRQEEQKTPSVDAFDIKYEITADRILNKDILLSLKEKTEEKISSCIDQRKFYDNYTWRGAWAFCSEKHSIENILKEYKQAIDLDAALERKRKEEIELERKKQIASYELPQPDLQWIGLAILPPTIGVIIFILLSWTIFFVGKWMFKGFSDSNKK